MKDKQTRNARSYKATDKYYIKAKKRAIKEGDTLAGLIEVWVRAYAEGYSIISCTPSSPSSNVIYPYK